MGSFQTRFNSALKSVAPVCSGDVFLIACSGGGDSTALLHLMHRASSLFQIRLAVAHLNHGLRLESDEEERFCGSLCKRLGIPFIAEKAEAFSGPGSVQMRAREYRYAFFNRIADSISASWIVLAHNRDDVMETFFLSVLAGCAPAALASIPPRRGQYIRPLLSFSHQELTDWLEGEGERWMEDPSNQKTDYDRNYLRNQVLPLLERRWPHFQDAIARLVGQAADENRYWEALLEKRGLLYPDALGKFEPVPLASLRDLEQVSLARFIAGIIRFFGRLPGTRFFDLLSEYLRDDRPRIWLRGRDWWLYSQDGFLFADRSGPERAPLFSEAVSGKRTALPWGFLLVAEEVFGELPGRKFFQAQAKIGIFFFDKQGISGGIRARSREPGDRIKLSGGGSRKIKDVLIDGAIPHRHRNRCTVLEDSAGIFAFILPTHPGSSRVAPRAMVCAPGVVIRLSVDPDRD